MPDRAMQDKARNKRFITWPGLSKRIGPGPGETRLSKETKDFNPQHDEALHGAAGRGDTRRCMTGRSLTNQAGAMLARARNKRILNRGMPRHGEA